MAEFIPQPRQAVPLTRTVETESGRRTFITCPRCEEEQDVLAFKPLAVVNKYVHALNGIVKCPLCKHVFSPRLFS